MIGYVKLFGEILDSTIWQEAQPIRIVWITMLAMKDRDHIVRSSLPGLAHRARVTLAEAQGAIDRLSAPDKFSRSKDNEGRRIEAVDGGWLILNGEKYRNKMNLDERREYQRLKQSEYRARKKDRVPLKSSGTASEREFVKRVGNGEEPTWRYSKTTPAQPRPL